MPSASPEEYPRALILLKAGSESPPIFMAHGLGGTVNDLCQLASQLRIHQPIYGVEEKEIDGRDAPLQRIEAIAESHLEAIRQIQPHGPYFLIGYSLGGLVLLEIARRLSEAGEQIALLALLDSYPYRSYLALGQRVRLLMRLARLRVASVLGASGRHGTSAQLQHAKNCQFQAWQNYRPHFYEGKISFVKAASSTFLPDDPGAIWGSLTRRIEVETVPGDHLGMLTTNSEAVARILSRYLDKARPRSLGH